MLGHSVRLRTVIVTAIGMFAEGAVTPLRPQPLSGHRASVATHPGETGHQKRGRHQSCGSCWRFAVWFAALALERG
jgi:hypothetical protein